MADAPETLAAYRMLQQLIEVCYQHGLRHAILSPGSRSAPIALSFLRHGNIRTTIIPDERAAAYTALGIAQSTGNPVALVCTSGTAALNYGPAVAEAYFSEIPLVVFTADRPAEWLGQADNQAVYQAGIYGRHVRGSYLMPADLAHSDSEWFAVRQMNEALLAACGSPKGPVHINVPLREPLYLETPLPPLEKSPAIFREASITRNIPENTWPLLGQYNSILVVAGTHAPDADLYQSLERLADNGLAIVPDITSNLSGLPGAITLTDLILESAGQTGAADLRPDLVISFGGPLVSKSLKAFLRHPSVKEHWHLGAVPAADTFQRLTKVLHIPASGFFRSWEENGQEINPAYSDLWYARQSALKSRVQAILSGASWSETAAMHRILAAMPQQSVLHLGNSLPIRHASAFPFLPTGTQVYSNRGTSGIDGSLSTAAGHAMSNDRMHTLILGDLSFLYDRNGLWNNEPLSNLRIIVFNNHGGGIFRMLPGASKQAEREYYFATHQPLRMEHTVLQHGLKYLSCQDFESLEASLRELYKPNDRPVLLEIEFPADGPSLAEVKKSVWG